MTQFFDNSHVTDVGLQGSIGPPVSPWEMLQQSLRQQYRVDSAQALREELRNRWIESLRAAQIDEGEAADPYDTSAYLAFAQHVQGQPIDTPDPNRRLLGEYDPTARIRGMIEANERIRQLNDPNIRTFEQIVDEVSAMQREIEEETASMSERAGWTGFLFGELPGAIIGSFTVRDPVNILTAPVGWGRTVATRIATDMAVAAGTTAFTELQEVAPARAIAGLPERNPVFNIAAAGLGAGFIRGGIEGAGVAIRNFQGRIAEDIDFDVRDSQLQQMFGANSQSPNARAGASILDDATFIERNNPYGEGYAANERFIAELRGVQRAMNGEAMTAVGRVLPPVPFEYIQKAADFEIVREQAPILYMRMEQAQARLADLTRQVDEVSAQQEPDLIETVRLVDNDAADQLQQLAVRVNDETLPEPARVAADMEAQVIIQRVGVDRITQAADIADTKRKISVRNLRASRRAANREYRSTYRAVEAEAARLRETQARAEAAQQSGASNILARVSEGRPFLGPLLRYDAVEAAVERINKVVEGMDEAGVAAFVRQVDEEGTARTGWMTEDGRIDIGLREPVDPDFRVVTEDGNEISVADAMRDLQDDADLVEAVRSCSI